MARNNTFDLLGTVERLSPFFNKKKLHSGRIRGRRVLPASLPSPGTVPICDGSGISCI